jgi:hypothetical protein
MNEITKNLKKITANFNVFVFDFSELTFVLTNKNGYDVKDC